MSARIQRENSTFGPVSLTASAATSARIPYRTMAGGVIFVTAVSGAASISWFVAPDDNTTPVALADAAGNAVSTPIVAGKGYEFPGSLYGAQVVCPVLNAGTATATINVKA
jgi:hypothetical protein